KEELCRFRTIVLLDDFSASGISYVGLQADTLDGKVGNFLNSLLDQDQSVATLANVDDLDLLIVLYMATEYAAGYVRTRLEPICRKTGIRASVHVVYPISERVRISKGQNSALDAVIDAYYDETNETDSTRLGRTDLKYGFAGCGLPLILS